MSGAVSPWQPRPGAQPLRAWSKAQLAGLARAVTLPVQAWQSSWGLAGSEAAIECAGGVPQHAWQMLGLAGDGAAWSSGQDALRADVTAALFGAEAAGGPLAGALVERCARDLLARLGQLLGLQEVAGSADVPRPQGSWSGAVHVRLPSGLHLLLEAALAQGLLRRCDAALLSPAAAPAARPALVDVRAAVAAHGLAVQVELSSCELDVGTLQDLRCGDVVRLDHPLREPLVVRDAGGRALFGAFLVRRGAARAVELAALTQRAGNPQERRTP